MPTFLCASACMPQLVWSSIIIALLFPLHTHAFIHKRYKRFYKIEIKTNAVLFPILASTPEHATLFEDIAKYTTAIRGSAASTQVTTEDGPAQKRRKVLNGTNASGDPALLAGLTAESDLHFYVQDTSFAVPQRKKLRLEVTRVSSSTSGGYEFLRARNQATNEIEFGVPLHKIRK